MWERGAQLQWLGQARGLLIVPIELPWVATLCRGRLRYFSLSLRAEPKEAYPRAIIGDSLNMLQIYLVTQDGVAFTALVGEYRHYKIRMDRHRPHGVEEIPLLLLKVTVFAASLTAA